MRNSSLRPERPERHIRYLDQDQVTRLFKAAKGRPVRDRLILALCYSRALRTQEVCDLPADAVDLPRWEITVQGAKHGLRRVYSIPSDLRPLIRHWERERDRSAPTYFTGRRGPLHRVRVWQIFRDCADAAGIERGGKGKRGLGLHSLRHAAATHALDAGCDVDDLRDLLRHRNVASTSVYATLSTKRRNGYLKRLEESPAIVKVR